MAVRRGVRWTPYAAAAVLTAIITEERNWQVFDGWCASRNVAPLQLPWRRFLNLTYYWATRGKDEKQLKKFDSELANAVSRWNMEMIRSELADAKPAPTATTKAEARQRARGGELPTPPEWWNEDTAARESMMAARQLAARGGRAR